VSPEASDLLRWYDRHRRVLPWRAAEGETPDPYHVWLSEIMLQQTTVAAVQPYYRRFLALFPTVDALAASPDEQVMAAWSGLGYYARARNLLACARTVSAAGGFPRDLAGLRALPGVGAYTSAAIGAIAFGIPVVPVDGNVERVTSRLFAVEAPLPKSRPVLARAAATLGEDPAARARPSDFAQALFDLGATLCTPRRPACTICPWSIPCRARAQGIQERLPAKAAKREKPHRHGVLFHLTDSAGAVLLQRRPPRGLLGGMTELPGTPWREEAWTIADALAFAPLTADWQPAGSVLHGFTHFTLTLAVWRARCDRVPDAALEGRFLCGPNALEAEALPSLMRKALTAAATAPVTAPVTALADEAAPPQPQRRVSSRRVKSRL